MVKNSSMPDRPIARMSTITLRWLTGRPFKSRTGTKKG